jgi:hypothetical protein
MAAEHPSTPQNGFTAPWMKTLSTPEERYEVSDRGLCLRVERTGRKVFRWYYFEEAGEGRKMHALTLGPWSFTETPGHLTLAQGRAWLDRLKQAHEGGTLAQVEKELRTSIGQGHTGVATGPTVGELAKEFYEQRKTETRWCASSSRSRAMTWAAMVLKAFTTRAPGTSAASRSACEGTGVAKVEVRSVLGVRDVEPEDAAVVAVDQHLPAERLRRPHQM